MHSICCFHTMKFKLIPSLPISSLVKFSTTRSINNENTLYSVVTPTIVSERRNVPNHISKPPYSESGTPCTAPNRIEIKNQEQIKAMKTSCNLASHILKFLNSFVKIGITTDEIDCIVHKLCLENGAYPSPLNYMNFPKSICTSVNNVACHGIPDSRPLQNGDIVNIDITVYKEGMHGDCSAMFLVGDVDQKAIDLCNTTKEALEAAISICKHGRPFSAIGEVIQSIATKNGFSIVPAFVGHGIGSYFHGLPDIYNFNVAGTELDTGEQMKAGMSFTIEPVLSEGGRDIVILEDGWTAVTSDNTRTAQWEHTVLILENGVEILTK